MALIRNVAPHPVDITGGATLAPGDRTNIDLSVPHEAALLAAGLVLVIDPSIPPGQPAYPAPLEGVPSFQPWTNYPAQYLVIYQSSLYVSNSPFTSVATFNASDWTSVGGGGGGFGGGTLTVQGPGFLPVTFVGRWGTTGPPTGGPYTAGMFGWDSANVPHLCTADGSPGIWDNTTPAPAPAVVTGAATLLGTAGATLNGTVNPEGMGTNYYFEYGTDTSYGTLTTAGIAGSDSTVHSFSQAITGLTSNTTYHYRIVAFSAGGTSYGSDQTFPTLVVSAPPTVAATGSSLTTQTTVHLTGTVIPNNQPTTAYFEIGTTTAYGTQVPASPLNAGNGMVTYQAAGDPTGLTANTAYHWRLTAINVNGTVHTADQTFTTANVVAPTVVTQAATAIGNFYATLNGTINPQGSAGTTYHFELGYTTAYELGHFPTSDATLAFSDSSAHAVTAVIPATLIQNKLYHFRLVATGPGGTVPDSDLTFTTTNVALPARFHRTTFRGVVSQAAADAARVDWLWIQADSGSPYNGIGYANAVKALNPNVKVFLYFDPFRYSLTSGDTTGIHEMPQGSVPDAWMLHDTASPANQIGNVGSDKVPDPGNASFRTAVLAHLDTMISWMPACDGIMFDETNGTLVWFAGTIAGVKQSCTQYNMTAGATTDNNASWQTAVTGLLTACANHLHANGKLLLANTTMYGLANGAAAWQAYNTIMDGAMMQDWSEVGGIPSAAAWRFATDLANAAYNETNGKYMMLESVASTEAGQDYALAAGMLVGAGHVSLDLCTNMGTANDVWYSSYDVARSLGAATGAYTLTSGLYVRNFTHGNVKLNPTASTISGVPAYTGQINFTG